MYVSEVVATLRSLGEGAGPMRYFGWLESGVAISAFVCASKLSKLIRIESLSRGMRDLV